MVIRLLAAIGQPLQLKEFFKAHQGICGLIHLANCRHFGFEEDHGTPFLDNDQSLLKEILAFYEQFQFDCPLTLEINEPDYSKYPNYQATVKTLKKLNVI